MLKLRSLVTLHTRVVFYPALPIGCTIKRYATSASGKWKCPCGLSNFDFHLECYSCHKKRTDSAVDNSLSPLSLLGEVCVDDLDTSDLHTCRDSKDKTSPLEGIWMCPACNTFNGAQRASCTYCGERRLRWHPSNVGKRSNDFHRRDAEKTPVDASPAPIGLPTARVGEASAFFSLVPDEPVVSQPFKKGDWYCVCGAHNFSRNTHCRKCSDPRPSRNSPMTEKRSQNSHPGDWTCPGCNMWNFSWRRVCKRCNLAQQVTETESVSAQAETNAAISMATGWICQACHSVNPTEDDNMCVICGSQK